MKHLFVLSAFVLVLVMRAGPVPAQDTGAVKSPPSTNFLRFQTQGLQATADAGESGASSHTRAIIQVQATADGVPVEDLGPSGFTGNETGVITLPSGWSIETLTVGPGGCLMVPTMFTHPAFGLGIYWISVIPYTDNPACVWQRGTYSYVVTFNDGRRIGTALGSITIP
jgi:hypothetical protein